MNILMLVNWKVDYCNDKPKNKQPPDFFVKGEDYWFFKYFDKKPVVDVIDISSIGFIEKFEKEKIRFYVWQALKAIPKLNKYDLIVSHGMQSGAVISLWRRLFKTKCKHVVFDIGSFNSGAESGYALKMMQFASKSIDLLIYHTSAQIDYYNQFFPWVVNKSKFIKYGADFDFFNTNDITEKDYIVCPGKNRSDWKTLVEAYKLLNLNYELRLIGGVEDSYVGIKGVVQLPYLSLNEYMEQIRSATLCVLPLEYVKYSFGQMRLLQQMAMGKCVIASRVPSLLDYVDDGKNALFYEAGNVEDCAKMIKKVIDNPMLRKEIGSNAKLMVGNGINEKIMAKEIEKSFLQM